MTSSCKGIAFILNNFDFDRGKRIGSQIDLSNVIHLFCELGYRNIIHENLSGNVSQCLRWCKIKSKEGSLHGIKPELYIDESQVATICEYEPFTVEEKKRRKDVRTQSTRIDCVVGSATFGLNMASSNLVIKEYWSLHFATLTVHGFA